MDGGKVTSRIRRRLGRPSTLLALSAALLPAAFLWAGEGAEADTAPASMRYGVGSTGMFVAQDLARRTWGVDPCGGQVEVVWGSDEPLVNARSYWANPRSAYDDPALNVQCRIVFNAALDFSWEKFCTVLVHEYGHLAGRPHGADGPDVMSPVYRAPLPDCAATADPAAPAAPVATEVVDAPIRSRAARRPKARAAAQARTSSSRPRARVADDERLERFTAADRVFGAVFDGH